MHGLGHRVLKFSTLLGTHRVEHALHGCLSSGEIVDQLVECRRRVREKLLVLVDECVVVLLRRIAASVTVQKIVEVPHHLLQSLSFLRQVVDAVAQIAKLLVDDISAKSLLGLLEECTSFC